MKKETKIKIFKIILAIIAVIICTGITIYLWPVVKNLSTVEGQIAFKEKINNSGIYGFLSLFALQVAQIFLFIIPGEPIEILAGMCYGGLWGTIFMMISCAIVSTGIFWLVRKLGKQFIYDFCSEEKVSEEKVKKFEENKMFKNPKKIEFIIFILFFIPGTPKDLLTYVSGLFPIKLWRFIVITTIARIPSIITSTLAGANIATGNWKLGLALYAIIFLIVVAFIYIYNRFDKDKTAKNVIDSIK